MSYARLQQEDSASDDDVRSVPEVAVEMSAVMPSSPKATKSTATDPTHVTLLQVGQPQREVHIEDGWTVLNLKQAHFAEVGSQCKLLMMLLCICAGLAFLHSSQRACWMSQALQEGKNVRLIFQGRVLADEASLASCGVEAGAFVHCAVSSRPALPVAQPVGGDVEDGGGSDGEQLIEGPEWLRNAQRVGSPEWQAAYAHENGGAQGRRQARDGNACQFLVGFAMGWSLNFFATIWVSQPPCCGLSRCV